MAFTFQKFLNLFKSDKDLYTEEYLIYRDLKKFSSKKSIVNINRRLKKQDYSLNFNDPIDKCLVQSIIDGDKLLTEEIHQYTTQIRKKHNSYHKSDEILPYALVAIKNDRLDIFEYFIESYRNTGQHISPRFSIHREVDLVDFIIQSNKIDYFNVLVKHGVLLCQTYIEDYLENDNFNKDDKLLKKIEFIFHNFPSDLSSEKLNKNRLLFRACLGKNANLEVVKYLAREGASIELDKRFLNPEAYAWMKKWNSSKQLFDELNADLNKQPAKTDIPKKRLKI